MTLLSLLFPSQREQRFVSWYQRIFSISEVEQSAALQWVFGANLFAFFITFNAWMSDSALTADAVSRGSNLCWEYFQSCGGLAFLHALPYGYSQTFLYMIFFALMGVIVYLIYRREWVLAHMGMTLLFVFKFLALFVLTREFAANYEYYHIILTAILLFFPYKVFFLKFTFVLLYFLASTIKIHESWILGSYLTSLSTGLPIFFDSIAPVITGIVIVMQVIGSWGLLSNNPHIRYPVLVYFVAFHLYSGLLVQYRYPATVLPTLLILFWLFWTPTERPRGKRSIAGWLLVVVLVTIQITPILLIHHDRKMTLEGNLFGLYMFEANHQCISRTTTYFKDGRVATSTLESAIARSRCDPYAYLFRIQSQCRLNADIKRVAWTFDHSIDGGYFYRIVDQKNACVLKYDLLKANSWIQTPSEGAPAVGRPVRNIYI